MNRLSAVAEKDFIAPLHGLRGIAVLYVLFSHLGNGRLFLLPIPHDAIGKVGVWIFFALSAYLLTSNLRRELEVSSSRAATILQYAVHRAFRIYPLFIVALLVHFALGDLSSDRVIKHLLLVDGLGELWAIPAEFQYYFVVPVVALTALVWQRRQVVLVLAAAMLAALAYGCMNPAKVFSNELNVFPKIAPFLFGSMLAVAPLPKALSESRKLASNLPWVCLAGLFATTIIYRSIAQGALPNLLAPWLSVAIGASVAGLIHAALTPNPLSSVLGSKILVYIGNISFSIYLLHMFVIRLVQQAGGLSPTAQAWISLGLSILLASVSYFVIERPGINAGKMIGRGLRGFSIYRRE
jgi:peptidoglycan/LPS O-acetylase OafA/YrhL